MSRSRGVVALLGVAAACADGGSPGGGGGASTQAPPTVSSGGSLYLWEGPGTDRSDWCQLVELGPGEEMVSVQVRTDSGLWMSRDLPTAWAWTQDGRDVGFQGGCDSIQWHRFRVLIYSPG